MTYGKTVKPATVGEKTKGFMEVKHGPLSSFTEDSKGVKKIECKYSGWGIGSCWEEPSCKQLAVLEVFLHIGGARAEAHLDVMETIAIDKHDRFRP
jgi:hypothetical protein